MCYFWLLLLLLYIEGDRYSVYVPQLIYAAIWFLYKAASVCLKLLTELVEPVLASWVSHTSHRVPSLCTAIKERDASPPCMLFPHLIAWRGTLTLTLLLCKIKKGFFFVLFLSLKVLYYFTFRSVALENDLRGIGKTGVFKLWPASVQGKFCPTWAEGIF